VSALRRFVLDESDRFHPCIVESDAAHAESFTAVKREAITDIEYRIRHWQAKLRELRALRMCDVPPLDVDGAS
jgi:hypothetical protein